jgi:hypothetical protein
LGGFYRLFEVFSAGWLYPLPFFNTLVETEILRRSKAGEGV